MLFIETLDGGPIRIWSHSWGWFYRFFFVDTFQLVEDYFSSTKSIQNSPQIIKLYSHIIWIWINPLETCIFRETRNFPWVMRHDCVITRCNNNACKFPWMAHQLLGIPEHLGHLIHLVCSGKTGQLMSLARKTRRWRCRFSGGSPSQEGRAEGRGWFQYCK